jgi:hypothetical protein
MSKIALRSIKRVAVDGRLRLACLSAYRSILSAELKSAYIKNTPMLLEVNLFYEFMKYEH